jgi:hypothetical protein
VFSRRSFDQAGRGQSSRDAGSWNPAATARGAGRRHARRCSRARHGPEHGTVASGGIAARFAFAGRPTSRQPASTELWSVSILTAAEVPLSEGPAGPGLQVTSEAQRVLLGRKFGGDNSKPRAEQPGMVLLETRKNGPFSVVLRRFRPIVRSRPPGRGTAVDVPAWTKLAVRERSPVRVPA